MRPHSKEALSAYFDHQLSGVERSAVESHLRDCPECAQDLADLAAVDALVRENAEEPPPGYFDDLPRRWRERLERSSLATFTPRRRWIVPSWAYPAAAVLLVAVMAPFLIRYAQPPGLGQTPSGEGGPAAVSPAPGPGTAGGGAPAPAAEPFGPSPRPSTRPTAREAQPRARLQAEAAPPRPQAVPMVQAPSLASDESASGEPRATQPFSAPPEETAVADTAIVDERESAADATATTPRAKPESARAGAAAVSPMVAAPPAMELRKSTSGDAVAAQFRALEQSEPVTLVDVRAQRNSYRALVIRYPRHALAGDGWIRVVELGVRAAKRSSSEADWSQVRSDGRLAAEHLAADETKLVRLRKLLSEVPAGH